MRLDEVKRQAGDALKIEWKSFLLRPEPEPRPREKFVAYTKSWLRPGEMEPATTFQVWSSDHEPPSHSMPSAIAGKTAMLFGAEAYDRYHHNLLEAYFTENRTVSDPDVLADIAAESDIDRTDFVALVDEVGKNLRDAVIADHNMAVNSGITGVPAVVVNNQHLITGALETEQYLRVVERQTADAQKAMHAAAESDDRSH